MTYSLQKSEKIPQDTNSCEELVIWLCPYDLGAGQESRQRCRTEAEEHLEEEYSGKNRSRE